MMETNKCKWCGGEGSPLHSHCSREMNREGVSFVSEGIRIKPERAIVVLRPKDVPKREYFRIRDRDKEKLTTNEMKNKWLEPFDKFMERFEKTKDTEDLLSTRSLTTNQNDESNST